MFSMLGAINQNANRVNAYPEFATQLNALPKECSLFPKKDEVVFWAFDKLRVLCFHMQ
jgi:hypothetical protein